MKHSVANGEYRTRREQAEEGQAAIRTKFPASYNLGCASLDQLQAVKPLLSEAAFKRTRHILSENVRVLAAKDALLSGDPPRLGELMLQSHRSMQHDFEASCEEIDFLVDTAISLSGCHGSRMTGGGFGGCTVNLVAVNSVQSFTDHLLAAYGTRYGRTAEIYRCEAAPGAIARLQRESGFDV